MKFNFPIDKKTDTITISIYEKDIKRIRSLAEKYKCTQQDIYKTLINEALNEYDETFGKNEGKEAKPSYSLKRDFIETEDGVFDGGGDLRTKEAKAKNIQLPPQNFGAIAYCQYLLCGVKKFNLEDGIKIDDKRFCSEECSSKWIKSTKDLRGS